MLNTLHRCPYTKEKSERKNREREERWSLVSFFLIQGRRGEGKKEDLKRGGPIFASLFRLLRRRKPQKRNRGGSMCLGGAAKVISGILYYDSDKERMGKGMKRRGEGLKGKGEKKRRMRKE